MSDLPVVIQGAKGEEPRTPVEARNTLKSAAVARILDLVSEGEIEGLNDGLRSVYLDETPIENADGSYNFTNFAVDYRLGTPNQDYIPGYPSVESELGVQVELKQGIPWERAITNTNVNAVRVRLSTPALFKTDVETGDTNGHYVSYAIEVSTDSGPFEVMLYGAFSGKTMSKYERDHRIDLPPATEGWMLRVKRFTWNSDTSSIGDLTFVESIVEIIDAKLRYPHSAIMAVTLEAEQFTGIPTRAYDLKGRIIRVPSNYDPVMRSYSGVWDGTFKTAWTDNPAWIYFDLCTNERYGLGHVVKDHQINKWELYRISQYCDQMVPDGKGGTEPRFTCNVYLQRQSDAYKVIQDLASAFRGMAYWAGGQISASSDMPDDPVYTYTPANVINGQFAYQGSAGKTRSTVALVSWNDMTNFGRSSIEYVDDGAGIARYGIQQVDATAVGCTSQGQAQRLGRYMLATAQYETQLISFSVGLDGTLVAPGKIIRVADPLRAGKRFGGRIKTATDTTVTVDVIDPAISVDDSLTVILPDGTAQTRTITGINNNVLTVGVAFSYVPTPESIWAVDLTNVQTQRYRVLTVVESDSEDSAYTITAAQHVESKFDHVDLDTKIQLPPVSTAVSQVQAPPTNVVVSHYETAGKVLSSLVVNAAWDAAPGAVGYDVEYRRDDGPWIKVPRMSSTSVDIRDAWAGVYLVQVRAVNPIDILSNPARSEAYVVPDQNKTPTVITDLQDMAFGNEAAIAQEELDRIAADTAEATARANAIAAEQQARIDGDAQVASDAATDASNKVAAEASARADAILAEQLARESAITTEQTTRQNADDSLATQIALVSAGTGEQFDSKAIWYFDTDLESWSGNGAPTIVDGWLRPADHATDPYIESPAALGIAGESYRYTKVRIKRVGNPVWAGRLYWQTDTATWDVLRSAELAEPDFNADGTATIDWDDIAWWPGVVNRIRIDLSEAQTATDYYLIDWVAVGRPTPGAGVALVQDVQEAMVNADAAEALARETLAAQMRGDYTGTDAALVTQGLVFSERQARTTADSALASRADALEATVNDPVTGVNTKASLTEVAAVETRVDTAEGTLSSHGTKITALETTVNDPVTGVSATATAVDGLETRVTDVEAEASKVVALESRLGTVEGSLVQELITRSEKDDVFSSTLVATEARLVDVENQSAAAASTASSMDSRVTVVEGKTTAQATDITAIKSQIDDPATGLTANAGAIDAVQTTVTDHDGTLSAHASDISTLNTTVGDHTATLTTYGESIDGLNLKYGVTLDVNGYITGWAMNNNGTTGSMTIVADQFRIVSPGQTPKVPFAVQLGNVYINTDLYMGNGRIVSVGGGYMKVQGTGFGVGGEFLEWYGPEMAIASCSRTNGIYWFTNAGDAYFGGSLSAGVFKNTATSSQIGAATAETGEFGTNGNPKVVTYSLNYTNAGYSSTDLGGDASITATVQLQRSYNGGAWTTISTRNITGTKDFVEYEAGLGYYYTYRIQGASTFTDNLAGLDNFNYRAIITASSGWPTNLGGKWGTQNLTVTSVEE